MVDHAEESDHEGMKFNDCDLCHRVSSPVSSPVTSVAYLPQVIYMSYGPPYCTIYITCNMLINANCILHIF